MPISWSLRALLGGALPQGSSPGWPCVCHRCFPPKYARSSARAGLRFRLQHTASVQSGPRCTNSIATNWTRYGATLMSTRLGLYTTRRDERQYYHTDKPIRASLEVLAALPDAGHAELDECIRETEAAKAITHPIGYGRRFISWRIRASCRPLKRRLSGLIGPRKPGCGANSTNSLPLSSISTR